MIKSYLKIFQKTKRGQIMIKTILSFVWKIITTYATLTMFVLALDFWNYANESARKVMLIAILITSLSYIGKSINGGKVNEQ